MGAPRRSVTVNGIPSGTREDGGSNKSGVNDRALS
jgi:hypothetical protein